MKVKLTTEIREGRYYVTFEGIELTEMKFGPTHVFKFRIAEEGDLKGKSLRTAVNQETSPNKFNHWLRVIACGELDGKSGSIDFANYIGNKVIAVVELGENNFPKIVDLILIESTSFSEEQEEEGECA